MMARFERVQVELEDRDQYRRIVALVYLDDDGESLNEELVQAGHAWVYEQYCHISIAMTGKNSSAVLDKLRGGFGCARSLPINIIFWGEYHVGLTAWGRSVCLTFKPAQISGSSTLLVDFD